MGRASQVDAWARGKGGLLGVGWRREEVGEAALGPGGLDDGERCAGAPDVVDLQLARDELGARAGRAGRLCGDAVALELEHLRQEDKRGGGERPADHRGACGCVGVVGVVGVGKLSGAVGQGSCQGGGEQGVDGGLEAGARSALPLGLPRRPACCTRIVARVLAGGRPARPGGARLRLVRQAHEELQGGLLRAPETVWALCPGLGWADARTVRRPVARAWCVCAARVACSSARDRGARESWAESSVAQAPWTMAAVLSWRGGHGASPAAPIQPRLARASWP